MAHVALICMYDSWKLGIRILANALIANNHKVTVVHFKLPAAKQQQNYLANPLNYENIHFNECRSEVVLKAYNIDVNPWTHNELISLGDLLLQIKPDIIGLSTRSVYEDYMNLIMDQMRRCSHAVTVAGGHDTTFRPEKYLEHLDFACIGDGESAIVEMADCFPNKEAMRKIGSLVWRREDKKIVHNTLVPPSPDNDYFFTPAMVDIPHFIIENNQVHKSNLLLDGIDFPYGQMRTNYFTMVGRGCAWNCSFCSAGRFEEIYSANGIASKRRRNRPIINVVNEIKFAQEAGYSMVFFMDSFLLASKSYLLELFEMYGREVGLPFFAQFLPDQVVNHPDMLDAAVRAGMVHTVIGIQSASEAINRDVFNRSTPNDITLEFAKMVTSYDNLKLDYHLITHNPFETESHYHEAIEFVGKLPRRNAQLILQKLRPFVNTDLERKIREANLPPLDHEIHAWRSISYLMRFAIPDEEFSNIQQKMAQCNFHGLVKLYAEVVSRIKDAVGWSEDGWKMYLEGKLEEALISFGKSLAQDPRYWHALVGKGWALQKLGRHTDAVATLEFAIELLPYRNREAVLEASRALGWAYLSDRQPVKAAEQFQRALDHVDTKSQALRVQLCQGLGAAALHRKENANARYWYEHSVEVAMPDQRAEAIDELTRSMRQLIA